MAKHPKFQRQKKKADKHKDKAEKKEPVGHMSTPPGGQAAHNPKRRREEDYTPTPTQVVRCFILWLRGFHWSREKAKATDWLMVVLTLAVAGAGFWSAWIFQGQLEEARKTTRLSVRPWIGLDDELAKAIRNGPLYLDDQGNVFVDYEIWTKNFGQTPASNVTAWADVVVSDDLNAALEQQPKACGDAVIGKKDIGQLLFPSRDRQFSGSKAIGKIDARHGTDQFGNKYIFSVWLIGCVGYRDQLGYLYRNGFRAIMIDPSGKAVQWQGAPKGPLQVDGRFVIQSGSIDSGSLPLY